MKTVKTSIELEWEQFQTLERESSRRQIPIEQLLAEMVEQSLAELIFSQKTDPIDHMAIVGLGKSDASDVSERHDYYLGEALAHEHLR